MAYPISDVVRRIVYSGSAGVGPYSFSFEVLEQTDVAVYKNNTLLTLTTDYTVSVNGYGTGNITLVVAATSADTITLAGARAIERSTDFVTGGDLFANSLNDELDAQTIFAQQQQDEIERSIKAPVTDPTSINMTLPDAESRSNRLLAFDDDGQPFAIGDASGAEQLFQHLDDLSTVADIAGDVSTVAAISDEVVAVSGNQTLIEIVARDLTGQPIVIDYGDLGEANNPAYPQGVLGAIYSSVDDIALVAAADDQIANVSENLDAILNASVNVDAINEAVEAVNAAATEASNSAEEASTYATNAETSANNASTSATNASNSASAASTSASNASTSASNASTSASNASTSASNAAASEAAAAASYDSFDDRYLGSKSSAPTLDNDGNTLITGALYWNSTSSTLWVWTGSAWTQATLTAGDFLSSGDIGVTVQAYDADLTTWAGKTAPTGDAVGTSDTQTLTNKTIEAASLTNGYTEEVYALGTSGSLALNPANGSIQTCALTGNPTFSDSLAAGQSIVLMLTNGSSYTVTYPTMTWITAAGNAAPTLTAADTLVFWKVSTTLYGAYVGSGE